MKKISIFLLLFAVACNRGTKSDLASDSEGKVSKAIEVSTSVEGVAQPKLISAEEFTFEIPDGKIMLYTIKNKQGMICQLTNFGARVVSLYAFDKDGKLGDVVAGYGSGQDFVEKKDTYFGATVGRFANRIAEGKFSIDGVDYQVDVNNGENHIHGGSNGFHRQLWKVEAQNDSSIVFSYVSPDMEMGFPGTLSVEVEFLLSFRNELKVSYRASTDKKTHINLTNHSYFNLKDGGASSVLGHVVMINADKVAEVVEGLIPTGSLVSVEGTAVDFLSPKEIGKDIDSEDFFVKMGQGYDHSYALNSAGDLGEIAARIVEPESGRVMEVYTTEPSLHFYSGNYVGNAAEGKGGVKYAHRNAFCVETQHFPDSPNREEFPGTLLEKGEEFESVTVFRFGFAFGE